MKVDFNKGLFSVTAETKEENEILFNLVNNGQVETTTKRKYTKRTEPKTYRERVAKKCPVNGCDKEAKSLALHMLMAHGIHQDGTVTQEVEFSKGKAPVPKPVVALPNGEYRLQKTGGLLA